MSYKFKYRECIRIFASSPVWAAFSPQFGFDLANPAPLANSNITFVVNQPTAGETGMKKVTVQVPAGFEFTNSAQIGQDEKIGDGIFVAGLRADGTAPYNTNVSIFNDQTISSGQKAHWIFLFDDGTVPLTSWQHLMAFLLKFGR